MHIEKLYDKLNNKVEVGYRLFVSITDPKTKTYKNKTKTFYIPQDITTSKGREAFLNKCKVEWQAEVDKYVNGECGVIPKTISFCEYAHEWVENILKENSESYNHYQRCSEQLKIFEEHFGKYTLQEITQPIVQSFCYWLQARTYKKEVITTIKDIRPIIQSKKMTIREVASACGISHATLSIVRVGARIERNTAEKICEFLGIRFKTYFDCVCEERKYSKSANQGLKVMLHSVLQSAMRQGLISVNYASKEFVNPVKGTEGKKEIFKDEEVLEFLRCVENEKDLRKKVAFSLMIELGLRGCEIAGLEWSDFDFVNNEVTINRNTMYISPKVGIITKKPKTENSNRTVSLPKSLVALLLEYKAYWDEQKYIHGHLWAKTNRLYVQQNGNDMSNMTIRDWLRDFEKKNGLKKVSVHGLRHSNITYLISNGVDIKTVSARAGHSDVQTTLNIYTHYSKQADRQASDLFDRLSI